MKCCWEIDPGDIWKCRRLPKKDGCWTERITVENLNLIK